MVRAPLKQVLPWAMVAAVSMFGKSVYDARRRAEGREAVERAARIAVTDSLNQSRAELLKKYRVDTVAFWRTVRRIETVVDTLLRSDTVTLTQRESVLVFVADSLVQQCTSVVRLCEQRIAASDSLLSVVTVDRNYWRRKAEPSWGTSIATAAKWGAVGFGIGVLLRR